MLRINIKKIYFLFVKEEEEEEEEEEEQEEDATDRMRNDLNEVYDNDTNKLAAVQVRLSYCICLDRIKICKHQSACWWLIK